MMPVDPTRRVFAAEIGSASSASDQATRALSGTVSLGFSRNAGEEPVPLSSEPVAFEAKLTGDVKTHLNDYLGRGEIAKSPVFQGMVAALALRANKPDLLAITTGFINEPSGASHGLIFSTPGGALFRKSKVDPNLYHPATVDGKQLKVDTSVAIRLGQSAPGAAAVLGFMARSDRGHGYELQLKEGLAQVDGVRREEAGGWNISVVVEGIKERVAANEALSDFCSRLSGNGAQRFAEACTSFENVHRSAAEILAGLLKAEGKLPRV